MVTSEAEPLGGVMGDALAQPVFQAGQMLTIVTFLFVQNPWLGLAAVALIPLQAWLIPRLQRRINLLQKERVHEVRRLSERIGESVARINTKFPHWFSDAFSGYNNNEAELPVDQHMLLALVAPRPLSVASATEDLWADPRGEFLSLMHASPVYELLGKNGLSVSEPPKPGDCVMRDVSYHIRDGKHDITLEDWRRYIEFFDRQRQLRRGFTPLGRSTTAAADPRETATSSRPLPPTSAHGSPSLTSA